MDKTAIFRFAALLALAGCAFKTPEEPLTSSNLGAPKEVKPFSAENAALQPLVYGNWEGKLPCADCEGINYTLTLQKDKTFDESAVYLDKNSKPLNAKGTWIITADSVIQLTKTTGTALFRLSKNNLVLLDQKGLPIPASAGNYTLSRLAEGGASSAAWMNKRKEGVDFIATGNEPSWSLDIDTEKMMRFQNGNLKLTSPVPTEQKLPEGKGMVYRAKTEEGGTLTVRLLNQTCTDAMSGREFPYKVEVTANGLDFNGCGQYLEDYKLNDIWALIEMNGKAVNPGDFTKGVPTLEPQLKPKRVTGNSGCNQLSGTLEVRGDKVSFGPMASTRMACPGPTMALENEYLKLLSGQTYNYTVEANRLTLRDKDKTVLVYKKVD